MTDKDDIVDMTVDVAVMQEKLKHLETLSHELDGKIKALEKDRDSALKWGIMVLGTVVISMGTWIFKYITKALA